jgi:WD40 repeat protein
VLLIMENHSKKYHRILGEYFQLKKYFPESIEDQRKRAMQIPPTARIVGIRKIVELPYQRIKTHNLGKIEELFIDLLFLESKAEGGMIYELVNDFKETLLIYPTDGKWSLIFKLIHEAIQRDIQFILKHPTTLFQCLWNSCWWYDNPEVECHYQILDNADIQSLPWHASGEKLYRLIENWHGKKNEITPGFRWLKSLRPPSYPLGGGQVSVLKGHGGLVLTINYSSDGRFLVSGGQDKNVRVWDIESSREYLILIGHEGTIINSNFIASNKQIYTISEDNTLRIWDAQKGQEIHRLCMSHTQINCVAVHPEGKYFIMGLEDGTLLARSINTGEAFQRFKTHSKKITGIIFSPNGTYIAVTFSDYTIIVLNGFNGNEVGSYQHGESVNYMTFSQDERFLASASGHSIDEYATIAGRNINRMLLKAGKQVVRIDNSVRIWDVGKAHEVTIITQKAGPRGLAFSFDGAKLAITAGNTIEIWSIHKNIKVNRIILDSVIAAVTYSNDDRYIALGSYDGTVRIFDAICAPQDFEIPSFRRSIMAVAYSPNGQQLAAGSNAGEIRLWCTKTGCPTKLLIEQDSMIPGLSWSNDNRMLVSAHGDGSAIVWDTSTGKKHLTLLGHKGPVWCVKFSPDGNQIATGSQDCTLRIWDNINGKAILEIGNSVGIVGCVAWNKDGNKLAIGVGNPMKREYAIIGWDLEDSKEIFFLQGHNSMIRQISFTSDETSLYSYGEDWSVYQWDTINGQCIGVKKGQTDVFSIAQGDTKFKYLAWSRNLELKILTSQTFVLVGSFPEWLDSINTHASGLQWAGAQGKHLQIIQIIGENIDLFQQVDKPNLRLIEDKMKTLPTTVQLEDLIDPSKGTANVQEEISQKKKEFIKKDIDVNNQEQNFNLFDEDFEIEENKNGLTSPYVCKLKRSESKNYLSSRKL